MRRILSRFSAVFVTAAFLGLIWLAIGSPLLSWRADMLERNRTAKLEAARLEASIERLTESIAVLTTDSEEQLIWEANQSGAGFATIQSRLSALGVKSGLVIRSITPLPLREVDGLSRAPVRVEFEADLSQLSLFLRDIEYATPALPIQSASIRRLIRPNEISTLPTVFVQLEVSAPISIVSEP